ncbi:hypothetical protein N9K90_03775 [Gammaproteobacteria bacterium]|nr:hypothetical protein [Gammaproteobacteria bacterium]
MGTLCANPKYLYPTLGKGFSGRKNAERFYRWFFKNFSSKVVDGQLIRQWVNETSVSQEYDVVVKMHGKLEIHRILGVLFIEGDKLGGVRSFMPASKLFNGCLDPCLVSL